jgi:hypothetical protein
VKFYVTRVNGAFSVALLRFWMNLHYKEYQYILQIKRQKN